MEENLVIILYHLSTGEVETWTSRQGKSLNSMVARIIDDIDDLDDTAEREEVLHLIRDNQFKQAVQRWFWLTDNRFETYNVGDPDEPELDEIAQSTRNALDTIAREEP